MRIWLVAMLCLVACGVSADEWKPAKGPLRTRWAKEVSPTNALPEYPRPQMVRSKWLNLNGTWDYAVVKRDAEKPSRWDGKILVPFPIESALSGVMKKVGIENRLWYRRTFHVPKDVTEDWDGNRILLHFDAVDWEARVWLNGQELGSHRGGYDPFTFDISKALQGTGEQELVLAVWDPTNASTQPRGKQVNDPKGIWYTSVTGIWQTVWLEPVPTASIGALHMTPNIDAGQLQVEVKTRGAERSDTIRAIAREGETIVAEATGRVDQPLTLKIADAKLWTPDSPFLYDLDVSLTRGDTSLDRVESYFGMRKIALGQDEKGLTRIMLNGQFVFQYGPLDQGWWPDGLYTAPTDEALRSDLEVLKRLGCNMLRKHVKVEPRRLYYWCDKLGLIVWQDMPNGDAHIRGDDPDLKRSPESAQQFEREWKGVIENLWNHPSIVLWVPFNEGWGQYDTVRITQLTKTLDPSRLVINASGWTDRGVGDAHDIHRYPGPAMPEPETERAIVLGEFGGLGLPMEGHLWWDKRNWGYRTFKNRKELNQGYLRLLENLRPMVHAGLSAAVYTQTTDVEGEVNGMMTYDREVVKYDALPAATAVRRLTLPPPELKPVVADSQQAAQTWRFTTTTAPKNWPQPDFDDSDWQEGPGGFGSKETPGAVVRTEWTSDDIWMRRTFELTDTKLTNPHLRIHHDENARIYFNGRLVAKTTEFTTDYILIPLEPEAVAALIIGRNTLAVQCHQTRGGQYIDVGIVEVIER